MQDLLPLIYKVCYFRTIHATILTTFFVFFSNAQITSIEKKMDSCLMTSHLNSILLACIENAIIEYSIYIDQSLEIILQSLPKKVAKEFKKVQNQWVRFKEQEFKFIDQYAVNTGYPLEYKILTQHFKMQILKDRAGNLKEYYDLLKF